jgi:tripartite-type tricarboxylate transporter receptor subunit TctC
MIQTKLRAALVAAACLFTAAPLLAQGLPASNKPVRLVVSFVPGGPVDAVARMIADELGKQLNRTVIVDNKPGANGAIGASEVARSDPDGSTLWLTSVGAVAINPALYEHLSYDMQRDFAPISKVVDNVEVLVVNPATASSSPAVFIAAAKKASEPPAMASSGVGSIPHLAIEQLTDATGVKFLHVPYKGAAPAITDVMAGQVAGFFGDIPGLIAQVKSGKLKALGIAADKRSAALPDVRTFDEQGIKGVDTINWYAIFAPKKTPAATVEILNKAVRATLANKAVHDRLAESGADPAPSSPDELNTLLKHDTDKWTRLIRAKNIKPE